MNILITGSEGFIGKNLRVHLETYGDYFHIFSYDRDSDPKLLEEYVKNSDFIFHLAGINRPEQTSDFEENHLFTSALLSILKKNKKKTPFLLSSSTQAELDNPYGQSKKKAEELVRAYGQETGADIYIFRLPGVFGKWCSPNYNSVVATFCYHIAHSLPIRIDDPEARLLLVYIDDLINTFTRLMQEPYVKQGDFSELPPVHQTTVGELETTIRGFRESRENLLTVDLKTPLTRKLYSTYLSYLPEDEFSYPLKEHHDNRGVFAECQKWISGGQISVNITKPGMTKGGHWHHTKTEKFLAVSGSGLLRFQKVGSMNLLLYPVSSQKLEIVDIPPGYIHDVTNTGSSDLVLLIWSSQLYDPLHPDTYKAAIHDDSWKKE